MLLLAHHEVHPGVIATLVTLAGPALLALRIWVWEQRQKKKEHRH